MRRGVERRGCNEERSGETGDVMRRRVERLGDVMRRRVERLGDVDGIPEEEQEQEEEEEEEEGDGEGEGEGGELALWSPEVNVVELEKGSQSLGFSILDYQHKDFSEIMFLINVECREWSVSDAIPETLHSILFLMCLSRCTASSF
ncbi:UNVERIFIED_CONTAM: hypothetical protein FKN15_061856 [Acipenser sinensis]